MQTLQRTIELDRTRATDDGVPCVLSTDVPVDRGTYVEVLEHTPAAVDLSRAPLPLIEGHDASRVNIGVVEGLKIAGGKLRGIVRFGTSARARELLADVKAGIVRGLSIGYQIHQTRTQGSTLIATRWTPYELSAVAVPADVHAGFYRGSNMTTDTNRGEASRVADLLALGREHNMLGDAEKFIRDGAPVQAFQRHILDQWAAGSARTVPASVDAADFLSNRERKQYSLLDAVRAQLPEYQRQGVGRFELEVSAELAKRAGKTVRGVMVPHFALAKRDLTTATGDTYKAGNLVATDLLADQFIDVLRNVSVTIGLGARVLTGLVGNVSIPRKTAGAAVQWVSEGNAPSEADLRFDQVQLSPKTAASYVEFTRKLLLQSTPSIEELVRMDLIQSIASAVDLAALAGNPDATATPNTPRGIIYTSGTGSVAVATNGSAPTWAHVVGLAREVAVDNAAIGSLAYVTNEKVRAKLAQTPKQSSGVEGNFILTDAAPDRLFGYKLAITNAVPSNRTVGGGSNLSDMIFGNWQDLILGFWSGVDVLVDPYSLSTSGGVRVTAFQDCDVAVRHAESFATVEGLITT